MARDNDRNKKSKSTRKHLFKDNEKDVNSAGKKSAKMVVTRKPLPKQTEQNVKAFVPCFEKPMTRAKTKSNLQASSDNVGRLATVSNVTGENQTKNLKAQVTHDRNLKQVISDKSNNNTGVSVDRINDSHIMINPDPDKFVLTHWGDVSILGKCKAIEAKPSRNENVGEEFCDGITVDVDSDEFDFEEEVTNEQNEPGTNSSSDEETLGAKRLSQNGKVSQPPVIVTSATSAGSRLLLKDQLPQFASMMSDLLDAKLKQLLPASILEGGKVKQGSDNDKSKTGKVVKYGPAVLKSPSDTTIYAPALAKQSDKGVQNSSEPQVVAVEIEQCVHDFVGAARKEIE